MSSGWLEGLGHIFNHVAQQGTKSRQEHNKINELNQQLQEASVEVDTFINLGKLDQALDALDIVIVAYSKLSRLVPTLDEGHMYYFARASLLCELGRNEDARISLRRAIAIKPEIQSSDSDIKALMKRLDM